MTSQAPPADAAQVVQQNVADLAQRQQARELGSSLARHVFRLLKVAQFHALDNMAFLQQVDQTVEALGVFGTQTGEPLSLLFTKSTVFVCGQLLKASRAEYEAALELSKMVRALGVTQLTLQTDANRADLKALARLFQPGSPLKAEHGVIEPSPRVRLRYVHAARLDENENELTPEEQVLRTYATTVVVMRRVYENLMAGRYQLPNQAKRLAQRLVVLSEGDTPAFLGVTGMRNLNHDAAGRAVNRAILAVSMGRQLTGDLATLSRIAMSALFFDVAVPLVTGAAGLGEGQVVVAKMTDQAAARLPAATAAVLTALGQVREASLVRTVIAYEAQWLRQPEALGPLYDGAHRPMVAARIVATAHRFNQLVEPDLAASRTPSVDEAITVLRSEAKEALDHAMLVLLIGALGVFPRGAIVELSTGERAVVLQSADNPAEYARPSVRLIYDSSGQLLRSKVVLDLSQDPGRQITRVIQDSDPELRRASEQVLAVGGAPPRGPASVSEASERTLRSAASTDRPPASTGAASEPTPRPPDSAPLIERPAPSARAVSERTPRSPSVEQPPPSSTPDSRRGRAPRSGRGSGAVELVEAPPSRRDPRSEDWDDEPPSEPSGASTPGSGSRFQTSPTLDWRQRAVALPPKSTPRNASLAEGFAPSAEGSLHKKPLSHLLLYLEERALGGTLVLAEPSEQPELEATEHAVFFREGKPFKAYVAGRIATLGSLLVGSGALEQGQLEDIALAGGHEAELERELIDLGLVRPEQIAEVRSTQVYERIKFLFSLAPNTLFAFYGDVDLLQTRWGRIPAAVSPRAALTLGLREHPEVEAMDRVLAQSAAGPLAMSAGASVDEFEFSPDELAVVIAIATGKPSLLELIEAGHEPQIARQVVYQLLLSRAAVPA